MRVLQLGMSTSLVEIYIPAEPPFVCIAFAGPLLLFRILPPPGVVKPFFYHLCPPLSLRLVRFPRPLPWRLELILPPLPSTCWRPLFPPLPDPIHLFLPLALLPLSLPLLVQKLQRRREILPCQTNEPMTRVRCRWFEACPSWRSWRWLRLCSWRWWRWWESTARRSG